MCDEAHRTTGVTLAGDDESNFVRVHDGQYLKAARRLYMTATPRIFTESIKDRADQHSAELVSMDDELTFGPEFHRLSFGEAVERGLLTDYKVMVLTVDQGVIAPRLQQELSGVSGELMLDDASKIVGCWNGLAKRSGTGIVAGEPPMRRAVAFAKDIKTSKQVAELFPKVVEAYRELVDDGPGLACSVRHVDGTFNALVRNEQLAWLKGVVAEDECRILSNARCLSEGVDVPALDAVLFLNPRNSIVDVVQSVGRVMRKSPGKDYGYVILPVAVPEGVEPSAALADNKRFKVVWQVLNALRSHDERFDAMVNSIALNVKPTKTGEGSDKLLGGHIGPTSDEAGPAVAEQLAMFSLSLRGVTTFHVVRSRPTSDARSTSTTRRSTGSTRSAEGTPRPRRLTPSLPWTRPSSAGTASTSGKWHKAFASNSLPRECGSARTDHLRKSTPTSTPTSSSTTVPTSFRRCFRRRSTGMSVTTWLAWAQTSPSRV